MRFFGVLVTSLLIEVSFNFNFIEICYTYRIVSAIGEENRTMSQLIFNPININKIVVIIIIVKVVIKLAIIIT